MDNVHDPSETQSDSIANMSSQTEESNIIGTEPNEKETLRYTDTEDIEKRPDCFPSLLYECICLLILCLAPASAAISIGSFQISIDKTAEAFNVTGGLQTWLVGALSLANGSFLLLMGGMADNLGRKNSIVACYAIFAVVSLIAGFMKNYVALCIFRALAGCAVAGATPAAAGIIGSAYKQGSQRKNRATAVYSAGAPLGSVIGYVIGGICVQFITWRAIHWFYAIAFGSLSVLSVYYVPNDTPNFNYKEFIKDMRKLDYIGSLISLSSFVLICFSLTQVDATADKWNTSYIVALLVVGIVLLFVFVLYEIYWAKNPIMPTQVWSNWNFSIGMVIMSLSWVQFIGILNYYGVLYFETIKGYSPMLTTACFLPMQIFGIMVNVFAALTMHIIPGTYLMIIGCLGFLAATIIWATMETTRNYWLGPFWAFCAAVVGADLTYNVANIITFSSVPNRLQSSAAGILNTAIQLSGTIGLGISSAIISAKNPLYGTPEQNDNVVALFDSYKYAYYFAVGCAGVSLILSCLLKVGTTEERKSTDLESENLNTVSADSSSEHTSLAT